MTKIIWGICAALGVAWLIGVVFKLFEDIIHFLLLPVGVLAVFNVAMRFRRSGPAPE